MFSSIKPFFLIGLLSSVSCTLNISVTKKTSSQTSPTISIVDVTPKESFFLGGEKIKISGSGFQHGLKIKIDDSECTDVSVLNANEIECRIPKYQTQTSTSSSQKLNITIASSDGTQVSLPESFQYKSDAFTKIEHFSGSLSHAGRKNGIGTNARFFRPSGVAIHDKYMYISDTGNQLIRRVNLTSLETEDFAGSYLQAGTVDGIGTNSKLNDPMGLTIVGGNLYVAENGSCVVRKINLTTQNVSVFAGQPGNCALATENAIGTNATFGYLSGITNDGNFLYVTDNSLSVRKISLTGTNAVSLAHNTPDTFDTVVDITYMNNALYLTNHMTVSSYHILKIDLATGNESLILSTSSRLGGITNDGQHLYVSLPFSRRIVKIDLSAPALTNTIGSGATGNSDGIGLSATLSAPSGLFFKNDEIFFASLGSHNIRKFNINNLEVTTLLGNNK